MQHISALTHSFVDSIDCRIDYDNFYLEKIKDLRVTGPIAITTTSNSKNTIKLAFETTSSYTTRYEKEKD